MAVKRCGAVITAFHVVLPSLSEPGHISKAANNRDIERKAQDEKNREEEIMDKWRQEEEMEHKEKEWVTRKPVEYPKVTISAFTETGRGELLIIVPLQRIYTGRMPVIPSILAGTPCTTLSAQGLLDHLNSTLGTLYSLDNPFLASLLVECMTDEYDLGMAYGWLRQIWYIDNWSRVVPWWLMPLCCGFVPMLHAWVDKKERTAVWMPINYYVWPVPIPKDADLNLIRIEMLNLGVEYAWLDVLCLRQEGRLWEDLCVEEWKLDVPTIGEVCAWMLQEIGFWRKIAGDTLDGPLHAECKDREYATELLTRFHKKLWDAHDLEQLDDVLVEMRTWVSTKPVDKIAGLAFLTLSNWIPAYSESTSLEHAWTALVDSMNGWPRVELFISCAEPGDAGAKWRPSWHQVMTKPLLPYRTDGSEVDQDETQDEDWCDVQCVEGFVRGLAAVKAGDRHDCTLNIILLGSVVSSYPSKVPVRCNYG
ncbi:hypothetical protein IW261DRAFT_1418442 [Armillaria novae-zelandiae]|uniref:Heterokaryon incompatibility domain-containing protein n=1 Tax=Armillaria novae-zelandiae TaxID=153914 RepID=A0AA39PDH9_9AGAR|nr:hypothetical protein IW261DRAFT_1418442 [Armillaria novae-zelandiae]